MIKHTSTLLFSTALLALTACGGEKNASSVNNENTSHPEFSWAKVAVSNNYSPSGEITNRTPTFTWPAIEGANEYVLGSEKTNQTLNNRWKAYTIPAAEAGCAASKICSYKPADEIIYAGTEKAWWIKGKINNKWGKWSSPYVFNVVNRSSTPTKVTIKPISPIDNQVVDNSIDPVEFVFEPIDTKKIQRYWFGYENQDGTGWASHYIFPNTICPPPAPGQVAKTCPPRTSFTPFKEIWGSKKLKSGKYTWWMRAVLKDGTWTKWSKGNDFIVKK